MGTLRVAALTQAETTLEDVFVQMSTQWKRQTSLNVMKIVLTSKTPRKCVKVPQVELLDKIQDTQMLHGTFICCLFEIQT